MSLSRCPKCRAAIPFEATSHATCGWNVRDDTTNGDAYAALKEKTVNEAKAEAEAFVKEHQLETHAEKHAYRREHAAKFGVWTRERIIAHWRGILDTGCRSWNPKLTRELAIEALRRLGAPYDPEA